MHKIVHMHTMPCCARQQVGAFLAALPLPRQRALGADSAAQGAFLHHSRPSAVACKAGLASISAAVTPEVHGRCGAGGLTRPSRGRPQKNTQIAARVLMDRERSRRVFQVISEGAKLRDAAIEAQTQGPSRHRRGTACQGREGTTCS